MWPETGVWWSEPDAPRGLVNPIDVSRWYAAAACGNIEPSRVSTSQEQLVVKHSAANLPRMHELLLRMNKTRF